MLPALDSAADLAPDVGQLGQQLREHRPAGVAAEGPTFSAGPVGEPLPGAHEAQVVGVELDTVIGGESELEAVREGHVGGILAAVA